MSLELILLVTGLLGLATAIVTFATKLQRIHVLVNNRMSEAIARIDQLIAALQDAGVRIPEKPEN